MSNMLSLAERMAATPERPARVLDAVTGLLRISDGEMADRSGWSRATVQGKRTGKVAMRPPDMPVIAVALDLPIGVFMMDVPEALRWIADNKPEWFDPNDDGGPGENVTTLRSSPAGVVQWESGDILLEAA